MSIQANPSQLAKEALGIRLRDIRKDARLTGRVIAGYPADIFPYCILVDHHGNVAGHGMLREPELIQKLRELRSIAAGK